MIKTHKQGNLFQDAPTDVLDYSGMVMTLQYDSASILRGISQLYNDGESFDFDPTYSTGMFYRKTTRPRVVSDVEVRIPGGVQADAGLLPFASGAFRSAVFDPPFLIKTNPEARTSKMVNRFGSYRTVEELHSFYKLALAEFFRVLEWGGLLVVKCQDTINARAQVFSHLAIYELATATRFRPLDLFVLGSVNIMKSQNVQRHARKNHSFFWVFRKGKKQPK